MHFSYSTCLILAAYIFACATVSAILSFFFSSGGGTFVASDFSTSTNWIELHSQSQKKCAEALLMRFWPRLAGRRLG